MATYQQNELMITTGAYSRGASPAIDEAIEKHEQIEEFLKQEESDRCTMRDTLEKLAELSETEIPEEEFADCPAAEIPSVAQVVDARVFEGDNLNSDEEI